jgi:hypothetical protein
MAVASKTDLVKIDIVLISWNAFCVPLEFMLVVSYQVDQGNPTSKMFSELTDRIKRHLILGISIESPVSGPMHKLCNGGWRASS